MGQGGFGITYIGFDLQLNTKVAIKEYYPAEHASRKYTQSNSLSWNASMASKEQWQTGCEIFLS